MSGAELTIASLTAAYGAVPVLAGIDLVIAPGELFCLLGPSGCGKTTLLRAVAGFVTPTGGEIRIDGQDVTRIPTERRGLGMVFQNYCLWPHLDVAGNVAFGLEQQGVPAAERRIRVAEALALVELAGAGQRRVAELSGGQQQRVALARALVIRPRLLLLDEPLSNLDQRLRGELREAIRRVCKASGVTALYVTHDQDEALAVADRLAVLVGGRVAQVGTPRDCYERPASRAVAGFLGAANLVEAAIEGDHAVLPFARWRHAGGPSSTTGTAAVCIRPERLRIAGPGANRCTAVISDGRFHGDHSVWTVQAGGISLRLVETAAPARRVGDPVELACDPADVVLVP